MTHLMPCSKGGVIVGDMVGCAGLPEATMSTIKVPDLDVNDAKGAGWMLVKGFLVVVQVRLVHHHQCLRASERSCCLL